MTVYFLRHGSCMAAESNPTAHPAIDDPLSATGRLQASMAAGRFRQIGVDLVVSSTDTRANETGAIIASQLGLRLEVSALFREWHMPTSVIGKTPSQYCTGYLAFRRRRLVDRDAKFEDGESLCETMDRVTAAKAYLLQRRGSSPQLVISHYNFMKFFAIHELLGPEAPAEIVFQIADGLDLAHTGACRFDWVPGTESFRMMFWNDHSHLCVQNSDICRAANNR